MCTKRVCCLSKVLFCAMANISGLHVRVSYQVKPCMRIKQPHNFCSTKKYGQVCSHGCVNKSWCTRETGVEIHSSSMIECVQQQYLSLRYKVPYYSFPKLTLPSFWCVSMRFDLDNSGAAQSRPDGSCRPAFTEVYLNMQAAA